MSGALLYIHHEWSVRSRTMKVLWIIFAVIGVWFLASAATENGLLPSGHGVGRVPEIIMGLAFVVYAGFRLKIASRSGPKSPS